MNSIQNFIIKSDVKNSREYLAKFGTLMRKVLNNSQSGWISLDEEFSALNLYIDMELMRFRNSFSYTLNVDNNVDLSEIKVPPLLIQPYVENAIHHGLRLKEGDKNLTINIVNNKDKFRIEICDNGIGREQSRIFRKDNNSAYKSFGTSITEKRINVFSTIYKSDFSVETIDVYEADNRGTKVIIKLKNKSNEK